MIKKKHENGSSHCTFNLVHLVAHHTLELFIKTFCSQKLLFYRFVMVLLSSYYLSRPVCLYWGFWTDSSICEDCADSDLWKAVTWCIAMWLVMALCHGACHGASPWRLSWHTNTRSLDCWRHRFRKALQKYYIHTATVKLFRRLWNGQCTGRLFLLHGTHWYGNCSKAARL